MATINFTGNVGTDPELRYTKNGDPVLSFRAAESQNRRNDDGSYETIREHWFNVSLFGPAAEVLHQHVHKRDRVVVAGDFWARQYEGQNGPGTSLDVTAVGIRVLPKRGQQGGAQGYGGGGYNTTHAPTTTGFDEAPF